MPKASETVLEIDLNALAHNYNYLRSRLDSGTKFLAVVKAFAYGSDSVQIGRKLEALGVDYLAVAYVQEGVVLREAGIQSPILVLHPQTANFEEIVGKCLEPSLYSMRLLEGFSGWARDKGLKDYPVHLKYNTGLNRLGFLEADTPQIAALLSGQSALRVRSVFSHLAASEDQGEETFTRKQITDYIRLSEAVDKHLGYTPFRHLLNTSGLINYPEAQFQMVRSGIGLYGFGNEAAIDAQLRPVATLKTVISQLHKIAPGESVGYNMAYRSDAPRITATLPLGHADGIGRQYGKGKSHVWLHGKAAPIIGNVCMDMIMIDVTGIECQEGDEVVIFGPGASAETLAKTANTISYELLTGISQRVKRLVLGQEEPR